MRAWTDVAPFIAPENIGTSYGSGDLPDTGGSGGTGGGGTPPPSPSTVDLLFHQGDTNWLTSPLPDTATLQSSAATSAAVSVISAAVASNSPAPWVNIENYSDFTYVVPASQAMVPVTLVGSKSTQSWAQNLKAMLAAGVPIPAGATPSGGGDKHLVVAQPDWTRTVSGVVYTGRYYELWVAVNDATLGWTCQWGGRMVDTVNRVVPRPRSWSWGAAANGWGVNGLAEENSWLATATKIPMSHTTIRKEELDRGEIRHPIGFMLPSLPAAQQATQVWPANAYDGSSRPALRQGTRARFLSTEPETSSWPNVVKYLFRAIRDYGVVFNDTAGNFAIRAEPGCAPYFDAPTGPGRTAALRLLPWANLKLLAVGSDSNQTPTG